ncbi:MAG: hypothetical protein ACRBCL_13865 [Maritimibacter sp.]
MALFSTRAPTGELEDLLEKERVLIMGGDISGVLRLAKEKARLLSRVMNESENGADLERLRAMAERNNTLLASAARGIKRATERLQNADETPSSSLKTYGRDGTSQSVGPAPKSLTKRA